MDARPLDPAVVKTWMKFIRARDNSICFKNPECNVHNIRGGLSATEWSCTCIPQDHVMFNPPKSTSPKADIKPDIGDLVDNNPKTRVGSLKCPMHLVPPSAEFHLAEALADGAKKYGPYNWRDEAISVSVYVGAMKRHLAAFWDGEDIAQDSGVHHLAHIMACCALMLDANPIGQLQDDRPTKGAVAKLLADYYSKKEAADANR